MRNKYLAIIIVACIVTLHAYSENHIKIDSIVVKQAPWHIVTPADVTCGDFENDISYMEYHTSDSIVISNIVRELNCLKESYARTLDVRCKIYVYSHGQVIMSACMDSFHVLYESSLYYLSPSLKNQIDCIIKDNIPRKPMNKGVYGKRDIPFPNGRDSLYSYLLAGTDELIKRIEKSVTLTVNCQIDSHGNTIKVIIKNRNHIISDDVKELVAKLTAIFMKDIKWIPDKERFPFETVSIPLRFMVSDEKNNE